jgi:glycerate kinase
LAVIEMSAAAGLALVPEQRRDVMAATTFGVGELIRYAAAMECRRVLLGLGGSATNDAGLGCLQAIGCPITLTDGRVVTAADAPLAGRDLATVARIGRPGFADGLHIDIACDVTNPLHGPAGAAHTFAPQKGATPEQVAALDAGLAHLAHMLDGDPTLPGGGAAGGIGWGLATVLNATLRPGIHLVADAVQLSQRIAAADLILTGEGKLDATSLQGKVVGHLAQLAATAHVPLWCVCGDVETKAGQHQVSLLDRFGHRALADPATCLQQAVTDALQEHAKQLAR